MQTETSTTGVPYGSRSWRVAEVDYRAGGIGRVTRRIALDGDGVARLDVAHRAGRLLADARARVGRHRCRRAIEALQRQRAVVDLRDPTGGASQAGEEP